jgi:hypothetical protein
MKQYKAMKQYRTASSPLLTIGQNPPGACAMKQATAIVPLDTKAA